MELIWDGEALCASKGISGIPLGWEVLGMVEVAPTDREFAATGFSQHIWTDVDPNPPPSKDRSGKTLPESPSGIILWNHPLGRLTFP